MSERVSRVSLALSAAAGLLAGSIPSALGAQQATEARGPAPWTLLRDLEYARPAGRPLSGALASRERVQPLA